MEPRDLFKKLHPNQFSDSKVIDKIECLRELLDFHLSKLSEQNKHFDFEDFIRNLLEREICPNLIEEINKIKKSQAIIKSHKITRGGLLWLKLLYITMTQIEWKHTTGH